MRKSPFQYDHGTERLLSKRLNYKTSCHKTSQHSKCPVTTGPSHKVQRTLQQGSVKKANVHVFGFLKSGGLGGRA